MKIINNIQDLPQDSLALTIGFFDGVHAGHRFLINELKKTADAKQLRSAILTFWPHPRTVLHEAYQPHLLNTIEEKYVLFQHLPIDYCILIPFTQSLAQLSAFDFMKSVLYDQCHVKHLMIGYDHRFGHNRMEGFDNYCHYGQEIGIEVSQAPVWTENGDHISSSVIRRMLTNGEIEKANHYLGYPYAIKGKVVHGKHIGHTIGFPTANIEPDYPGKIIPLQGVYAVRVWHDNQSKLGMVCIGTRPTFEEKGATTIEANIFDCQKDLYNQTLTIEFLNYLRPQKKFDSKEALIQAMEQDRQIVIDQFGK